MADPSKISALEPGRGALTVPERKVRRHKVKRNPAAQTRERLLSHIGDLDAPRIDVAPVEYGAAYDPDERKDGGERGVTVRLDGDGGFSIGDS
jgi:hypothetical protein